MASARVILRLLLLATQLERNLAAHAGLAVALGVDALLLEGLELAVVLDARHHRRVARAPLLIRLSHLLAPDLDAVGACSVRRHELDRAINLPARRRPRGRSAARRLEHVLLRGHGARLGLVTCLPFLHTLVHGLRCDAGWGEDGHHGRDGGGCLHRFRSKDLISTY